MAKAALTLANGTKVQIEGDAREVATLIATLSGTPPRQSGVGKKSVVRKRKGGARKGSQQLIVELTESGYFKSRRTIGDIQTKLEEGGHIYPLEQLSTPLLRLTRSRVLRRIREKSGWVYVG